MDFTALALIALLIIWIIGSFGVGMIASKHGESPSRYILVSLLVSPLVGGVVLLLSKQSADVEEAPDIEPAADLHSANTNILAPEEAAAMRLRAEEEAPPVDSEEMTALQKADTNVFTPEEMEAIREKYKYKENKPAVP